MKEKLLELLTLEMKGGELATIASQCVQELSGATVRFDHSALGPKHFWTGYEHRLRNKRVQYSGLIESIERMRTLGEDERITLVSFDHAAHHWLCFLTQNPIKLAACFYVEPADDEVQR